MVAFGTNETTTPVAGVIDITGLFDTSFSMPRDGVISSISAYFSISAALSLVGSSVTITAQLYSSSTPDDTFTAISGAAVTLAPALTGLVAIGDKVNSTVTGLSIPVTNETRLLMVFSAAVTAGIDIATVITGFASAGLSLS